MKDFKDVLRLAAPIAVLQVGMVLYGTVDTLFMGFIGPEAIAGVGLGATTFFFVLICGIGTLLGVDALTSRAHGAGKPNICAALLVHALALAAAMALPLLLALRAAAPLYRLLGVAPSVAAAALAFLSIVRWAILPALVFAACRQYLQSLGLLKPLFAAVALGNLANVALDWGLVLGNAGLPALGVRGCALATVSSNFLMASVAALAALREARRSGFQFHGFHPKVLREILVLGLPVGGQMLLEVGVFAAATALAGTLGPAPAAAHQIALNLASVTFMVPMGVSAAAAVLVGRRLGEKDAEGAVRAGRSALRLGVGFMCLTGLLFAAFPDPVLRLYTSDPGVLGAGRTLLRLAALFQVFDGVQVVMAGALRGLGETRLTLWANLAGHWLLGLPLGAWLCFARGRGAPGLWAGLCAGLMAVAVLLYGAWRLRSRPESVALLVEAAEA